MGRRSKGRRAIREAVMAEMAPHYSAVDAAAKEIAALRARHVDPFVPKRYPLSWFFTFAARLKPSDPLWDQVYRVPRTLGSA